MEDFFTDRDLLEAPPVKRAAYSDRTSWIMAEISRLVYEPLPSEVTVDHLLNEIKEAVAKGESDNVLEALLKKGLQQHKKLNGSIAEILKKAEFEFVDSFAVDGTEAVLVKLKPNGAYSGMLVLAFRGTQACLKDITTDLKADLVSAPGGGRIHHGFLEAYQKIESQIKASIAGHDDLPLYITGHSLGGALAMVTTRYLGYDSTGATYTYGCPRVADDEFYRRVKTPVYRIVNSADAVPRVPFGYGFSILLSVIRLIPINGTKLISEFLRRKFKGYTHYGNLVFLSSPANVPDANDIPFAGLKVKTSPNIFWQVHIVLMRIIKTRGKAAGNDHRMTEYSQKLLAYAKRRNL